MAELPAKLIYQQLATEPFYRLFNNGLNFVGQSPSGYQPVLLSETESLKDGVQLQGKRACPIPYGPEAILFTKLYPVAVYIIS
jgi:hypothetical protein